MKKKLITLLLLCVNTFGLFGQVVFRLTRLPNNTPINQTFYLAANFNSWNAADATSLFRIASDGIPTLTVATPTNRAMEFKVTRGTWASNEGNATGAFLANRTANATGGRDTINIDVASWQDLGASSNTRSPNVTILNNAFLIPQLGRTRRIWIYLPPSYQTSTRRFPVLYLQDGQNLFDRATSFSGEWEVDETLNRLAAAGDGGCIVVGIDNDGAQRLNEYSAWNNPAYGGGEADRYTRFIVETLKPYIDANYRTQPDRLSTGIGGSSMGSLLAMYAARQHEQTFGKVLVFSPAFWFARTEARVHARTRPHTLPTKVYFMSGANESSTMVSDMAAIRDSLSAAGFAANEMKWVVKQDGQHSEWFWAREFGAGYQWLFSDVTSRNEDLSLKKAFSDARLSPNPSDSAVKLVSEGIKNLNNFEIIVTDLSGKRVLHQKNKTNFDIQYWASGVYVVSLFSDGVNILSLKLVKK